MDVSPDLPFSQAFDHASAVTANRFTNPLWRIDDLLQGFKFRGCLREIKSFGLKVVNTAVKRRASTKPVIQGSPPSLHTILVDSLLDHISNSEVVADAAINFLSAGRDTTAQSLTWAFYSLLRHPEWKQRLLNSIKSSFPATDRESSLPLPYDFIANQHALPYVQAVFAEALRLNPAVPFELKESVAATTMPDGTELPAGAVVIWIPHGLARSEKIWGADAAEFNPERWLNEQTDGSTQVATRSAFENPVFNAGPRMCIGKRMAEVLAISMLTRLIWQWDFEEVRGAGEIGGRRVMAESLTAPMQGGLPVKVRYASLENVTGSR